jgi:hypothetical protein
MRLMITIFLFCLPFISLGQDSTVIQKQYYKYAYNEIIAMLEGKQTYDFQRAVFVTENAFFDWQLQFSKFHEKIATLADMCSKYAEINYDNFVYDYEDKETIAKYAAIFTIMTDSVPLLKISDDNIISNVPFRYDFVDSWGKENWANMFVTKLIATNGGNCHSLPYLYKMIAEELEVSAHLALAPNHIYIKHYSTKMGMYNTELTSAAFPIDGWLMASGYIHLDAIRNGIYMDTLTNQHSLALCLLDLAKGYERKFGKNDNEFTLRCCQMALKYYPNFINALLLKSEILKTRFDEYLIENGATNPGEFLHIPEAKKLFDEYEQLILHIHKLGYRKMPERMYMNWLLELKENQQKYANKKVIDNFKPLKSN